MSDRLTIELIDAYLVGEASPQQLADLEQAILASPEARNLFWDRARWHTRVRRFCERREVARLARELDDSARQAPPVDEHGKQFERERAAKDAAEHESAAEISADSSAPPDGTPPVKSPVLGFLGGAIDYVNHSRRLMFLLIAVMLCGWFVFQIGSVLLSRWWAGNVQVANRAPDQPGGPGPKPADGNLPAGNVPAHGAALAWLSGSVGGRWQIVAATPAGAEFWEIGTEFKAGQQVNLLAGLGEITFRSGATIVVSAPAQFSVTSALGADLQLGKLTARVPHDSSPAASSHTGPSPTGPSHPEPSQQGATGFTVNTPAGSVVDLGTEFGVEVTSDHKLNVQVFVGDVKINASPGTGGGDGQGIQVSAGKTAHVEPGKPPAVVESQDKDHFQRDLKIASDSSDKQIAAYLEFMRKLKPVVWLRMEGKEGDLTIHDEAGNAAAGKLHWDGPGNPFVNGRLGKSLWLRGAQLEDYAVIPDYPKAEHGKLSVSAWVYADKGGKDFGRIAANWGDRNRGQFHFALVPIKVSDPDSQVVICADVVQPDKSVVDVREDKSKPFPLNQWQHVAFTTDGATLRLYREGREVASAKQDGLLFPTPLRSLGVGVKTGDLGDVPSPELPGFFSGKLDEIAIFNDTLSPEDIKKLAAAPPK